MDPFSEVQHISQDTLDFITYIINKKLAKYENYETAGGATGHGQVTAWKCVSDVDSSDVGVALVCTCYTNNGFWYTGRKKSIQHFQGVPEFLTVL